MARVINNCGLTALQRILDIENVSMYTLLHLAKDNGLELYFCQVKPEELALVKRPAIFHSEKHFTYIAEDQALPDEKFTGYVLTSKPLGQPLPYALAKQIVGAKKGGGFFGSILPVLGTVVGNLIVPGAGGIVGGMLGGAAGAAASGQKGLGIGLGAITGGLGGLAPGATAFGMNPAILAGGIKAAGSLATGGGVTGALTSGLAGYAGQKIQSGAGYGATLPSTGLLSKAGNIAGSAAKNLTGNLSTIAPSSGTGLFGGQANSLSPYNASGGANIAKGMTSTAAMTPGTSSGLLQSTNNPAVQNATNGQGGGGLMDSIFGPGQSWMKTGAAALAGIAMPQPANNQDSMAQYDKAAKYLEGRQLPQAQHEQLNKYLGMSIDDITKDVMGDTNNNRAMLELDKAQQAEMADVERRAAASGQDWRTSSDVQNRIQEINRQHAEAKANLGGDLEQKARQQAIDIKKWALDASIKQGQVDMNAAMDLAKMQGEDEKLRRAIETDNYEEFQRIIALLLSGNEGSTQPQNNAKQLAGATK